MIFKTYTNTTAPLFPEWVVRYPDYGVEDGWSRALREKYNCNTCNRCCANCRILDLKIQRMIDESCKGKSPDTIWDNPYEYPCETHNPEYKSEICEKVKEIKKEKEGYDKMCDEAKDPIEKIPKKEESKHIEVNFDDLINEIKRIFGTSVKKKGD